MTGPAAGHQDWRMRYLDRRRIVEGVVDLIEAPLETGRWLVSIPHAVGDFQCFGQARDTLAGRRPAEAVRLVLVDVPAGAKSEDRLAAADVVERGGHLDHQGWIAEGDRADQHAGSGRARERGQRGHTHPALEAIGLRFTARSVDVVETPVGVEPELVDT